MLSPHPHKGKGINRLCHEEFLPLAQMHALPKGSALPGFNKPFHRLTDETEAQASDPLPPVPTVHESKGVGLPL